MRPLLKVKKGGMATSFQEALETLSRDERFKATVYAMNSLMIQKGVYAREQFERMSKEWAEKERAKTDTAMRTDLGTPSL
jgi:hypothetical protein